MADFTFNPTAALGRDARGHELIELELGDLSRPRATSFMSFETTAPSFPDDDRKSLIDHRRLPSDPDSKILPTVRVNSETPTVQANREARKKLQGWRFGVACSAWTAFSVLVLNFILAIVGVAKYGTTGGVGTAYMGSCTVVTNWATWLHILINALSSILLSASNYTMQCLSSPTRTEIDRAHAKGDWMDVGVASVRNLSRIHWRRLLLWALLALSSIPIHLLYNSAVFKTLDANDYTVAVMSPLFLDGFSTNTTISPTSDIGLLQSAYRDSAQFQNLSNSDCIAAYGTSFVSGRGGVLAVTDASNQSWYTTISAYDDFTVDEVSYGWICGATEGICDVSSARQNATNWEVNGEKIAYCLSEIVPSRCKLQFSLQILITVILMNAVKSAVMFATLYWQRDPTVVTVGDALASFLGRPDELTKGRCLMAKVDVSKGPLRWRLRGVKGKPNTQPLPVTYYGARTRRWFAGSSIKRWLVTMGLCVTALCVASALLGMAIQSINSSFGAGQSAFSLGFGAANTNALIEAGLPQGGAGGLVLAVLLANCPQAIVSFLYLTYNGLFTSMLLASEWSKYGQLSRRRPLRVTTPRGQQRSTYYLHLPYRFSIPLIIVSATLHWLISESIFLVRVAVYSGSPNAAATATQESSQVGFSCLPILLTILLGIAMLSTAVGFGFRKLASGIPVAGSCSVAIAAAAHRPSNDLDAAFLSVRWGEINSDGNDDVGHCAFSSEEVHELLVGRLYAGTGATVLEQKPLSDRFHPRRRRVW